jgi:hypothetical protein
MGMLFNTDATVLLMTTLNNRYNLTNLPINKAGDLAAYNSPGMTLYQIWRTFGTSLNTGSSPNGEANFSALLKDYAQVDNGDGTLTSDTIRTHLVTYLGNANCLAIEFFAIPSHQIVAHPRFHVPHPAGSKTQFTGIVSIETVTYDKAASFVSFLREHKRE